MVRIWRIFPCGVAVLENSLATSLVPSAAPPLKKSLAREIPLFTQTISETFGRLNCACIDKITCSRRKRFLVFLNLKEMSFFFIKWTFLNEPPPKIGNNAVHSFSGEIFLYQKILNFKIFQIIYPLSAFDSADPSTIQDDCHMRAQEMAWLTKTLSVPQWLERLTRIW